MKKVTADSSYNERGAALLEFAICIPVLVALLQGVVFTCSSLSNLISVSQMAYSSALAGIEVAPSASSGVMGSRANLFLGASEGQFDGQVGSYPFGASPFPAPDEGNRLVTVRLSPKLKSGLSGPFAVLLGGKITAPLLYVNRPIDEILSRPANPVGRVYDCDGSVATTSPGSCSSVGGNGTDAPPPPSGGCRAHCFIDTTPSSEP